MSRSRSLYCHSDTGPTRPLWAEYGAIRDNPDTGLGKPFISVFLVIYHSMRLSLEGVLDVQNSVEIMRLLDRHTRSEIKITTQRRLFDRHTRPEKITTGIDEGRNPPMPAVPEG